MPEPEARVVPLEWEGYEDAPTVFANQFIVSHASRDEFYLLFGEAMPPPALLLGGEAESVKVRTVAKIAVSAGAMMRIARAIEQNVSRFIESVKGAEDEPGVRPGEEPGDAEP